MNSNGSSNHVHLSPGRRSWLRFKANRRGYISLWLFGILFVLSLFAEVLFNDKPLVVNYQDELFFPFLITYPETTFGGDFDTEADYSDTYVRELITAGNNWVIDPLIHYSYNTINFRSELPNPAPPTSQNLIGTDDRGRDVFARLVYGFRLSVLFAFALTALGVAIGILAGAVQGYFSGRLDLIMQRLIEVWASMPELYLLIIFASIFQPSIWLLIILLSIPRSCPQLRGGHEHFLSREGRGDSDSVVARPNKFPLPPGEGGERSGTSERELCPLSAAQPPQPPFSHRPPSQNITHFS